MPAGDFNGAAGHFQQARQGARQFFIGGSFDGRRGDTHTQGAFRMAGDATL